MRNDELEVRPSTETPASEQELGRKQDETSEGPNRVFSSQIRDQLWRHAGMVRKPLPAGAMQTAVKPPLPWPKGGLGTAASLPKGPGPSRLASATFSGLQYSRSSVSSAGRISGLLAPDKRNPKSLKRAAVAQYEVVKLDSEMSAALSDSTAASPSKRNGSLRAALSAASLRSADGMSPRAADVLSHSNFDGSNSAFEYWNLPAHAAGPGGYRSDSASAHALPEGQLLPFANQLSAVTKQELEQEPQEECLMCGVSTCPAKGPQCIRCSECRGAMHKSCFVAHYHVVPGRRDWTYCPAHSLTVQAEQAHAASHATRIGKPGTLQKAANSHRRATKRRFVYAKAADGDALGSNLSTSTGNSRLQRRRLRGKAETTSHVQTGQLSRVSSGDGSHASTTSQRSVRQVAQVATSAAAAAAARISHGPAQFSASGRPLRRRAPSLAYPASEFTGTASLIAPSLPLPASGSAAGGSSLILSTPIADSAHKVPSLPQPSVPGALVTESTPSPTGRLDSVSRNLTKQMPAATSQDHSSSAADRDAPPSLAPMASNGLLPDSSTCGSNLGHQAAEQPTALSRISSLQRLAGTGRKPRQPIPSAAQRPRSATVDHPAARAAAVSERSRLKQGVPPQHQPSCSLDTTPMALPSASMPATPDADALLAKLLHQELNAPSRRNSRTTTPIGPGAL